jgi:hypothetical protein
MNYSGILASPVDRTDPINYYFLGGPAVTTTNRSG